MEQPAIRPGLIDTDILIDATRGLRQAGAFLNEAASNAGIVISAVSAMELMAGARDAAQLAEVKRFLGQTIVLPMTEAVSARAIALVEAHTLSHRLALPDSLIAATALESGLALYTRNVRHFRMIPEMLIIQPY